jgi:hypothetical protein
MMCLVSKRLQSIHLMSSGTSYRCLFEISRQAVRVAKVAAELLLLSLKKYGYCGQCGQTEVFPKKYMFFWCPGSFVELDVEGTYPNLDISSSLVLRPGDYLNKSATEPVIR